MDTPHSDITVATIQGWAEALTEVDQRIGSLFPRAEARHRALAYLQGLLSPAERKTSWQLAEMVGDPTPYGFQHLLGRAEWDADALRDALRDSVVAHLGAAAAMLVLDETGFLKKGGKSAGVARQYSGTAGRIETCQMGVFLTYVSPAGHSLLDRELYLPKEWTNDGPRCQQAGIPAERRFMTKPTLARQMLERVFAARVPCQWITGDSIYGDDRSVRLWLEAQERAYVLGVSGTEYVWIGWRQHQIKDRLAQLPDQGWAWLSAGAGAKGPRWYDWLRLPVGSALQEAGRRWLLVRRSLSDPSELTAYVVFAPIGTPLADLVRVAGTRWAVEVDCAAAKSEVGLDHYEVRSWTGWYRHITLALWAQAVLTVVRADANAAALAQKGGLPGKPPGSLTRFKARRGLGSG